MESFSKDPAEAVSHPEQCPRYSHAAANSCRGPGGLGGRERSIQAASHTSSPAAAPAAGSEPACTDGGEASSALPVCAGRFLRFGLQSFFKEVFIFCQFPTCFLYKQNLG